MSTNVVTFDPNRYTTSDRYLSYQVDARQPADPSKQESQDRPSEYSRSQTHPLQLANEIAVGKVTFALDKESEELYIQVVDRETGEVIREIPPVEMRRLANALKDTFGHLLDSFA